MNCIRNFWKEHKLNNVIYFIFYMLVCFPFVGINIIRSDTQPWALAFAIAIVMGNVIWERTWYRNTYTDILFAFLIICILVGIVSIPKMYSVSSLIRSGANYATVFFVPIATLQVLRKQGGLKENWIKLAIWIWFIVGFIQKYFYPQFGYFLLTNARTQVHRGVISLASEPSFYGYMCIFFAVIAMEFERYKKLYIGLCIIQIVLFAASSISILYMLIFAMVYVVVCICKGKPSGLFAATTLIVAGIVVYQEIPRLKDMFSNRIFLLIYNICYDRAALQKDASVSMRFGDIVNSLSGMIDGIGLPHGFSSVRIMSGYGAMIYEIGIIGVIMVGVFFLIMYEKKNDGIIAISLSVMLFSAIQLANPLFSFYIGYCLYNKVQRQSDGKVRNEEMKNEAKIDMRQLFKWIRSKWIILLVSVGITAILVSGALCIMEKQEYQQKTKELYTMEELETRITDAEMNTIKAAIVADDLIAMRTDELESAQSEKTTEESVLKQTKLLNEIEDLTELRMNLIVDFTDAQSRYYWLKTGTGDVLLREDIAKPQGLTKHIVLTGIAGGVLLVGALAIFAYIFMGYLHSETELEDNFQYFVCKVNGNDQELEDKIRFLLRTEKIEKNSPLILAGTINWNREENKRVVGAIQSEIHADVENEITENVECLEKLQQSTVLLVERANESKLGKIRKNDMIIRKAKGNIAGVIFIA